MVLPPPLGPSRTCCFPHLFAHAVVFQAGGRPGGSHRELAGLYLHPGAPCPRRPPPICGRRPGRPVQRRGPTTGHGDDILVASTGAIPIAGGSARVVVVVVTGSGTAGGRGCGFPWRWRRCEELGDGDRCVGAASAMWVSGPCGLCGLSARDRSRKVGWDAGACGLMVLTGPRVVRVARAACILSFSPAKSEKSEAPV